MWECTIGTAYFVLMLALQDAWQQRSGGFQLPSRSSDHVQQEIPDIPVHCQFPKRYGTYTQSQLVSAAFHLLCQQSQLCVTKQATAAKCLQAISPQATEQVCLANYGTFWLPFVCMCTFEMSMNMLRLYAPSPSIFLSLAFPCRVRPASVQPHVRTQPVEDHRLRWEIGQSKAWSALMDNINLSTTLWATIGLLSLVHFAGTYAHSPNVPCLAVQDRDHMSTVAYSSFRATQSRSRAPQSVLRTRMHKTYTDAIIENALHFNSFPPNDTMWCHHAWSWFLHKLMGICMGSF